MYFTKVTVKESGIDGNGVFTLQDIKAGELVWKFDLSHDKTLSAEDFDALDAETKEALQRIAYMSKYTKRWVYPPDQDPARYTNHSKDNNLSVKYDQTVSEEPIFIANRDIKVGEELTNNYHEFDDLLKEAKWLNK